MKLPSARGVIAVYGNQDLARIAEEIANPGQKNVHNLCKEKPTVKIPSPNEPEQQFRAKPAEETKKVPLFEGNTSKQVITSAMLDGKTEAGLIHFLRDNNDIFTWFTEDLRGVDRSIIEHILDVDKNHPQSSKSFAKCLKKESR